MAYVNCICECQINGFSGLMKINGFSLVNDFVMMKINGDSLNFAKAEGKTRFVKAKSTPKKSINHVFKFLTNQKTKFYEKNFSKFIYSCLWIHASSIWSILDF